MHAVIYARFSSSNQREESIEVQLEVCRQYAKEHGLTVVDEYIDRALTGTDDNRPNFQRMIEDRNKKKYEVVLTLYYDRFMRNVEKSQKYKRILRESGIEVIAVYQPITNDPDGRFIEHIYEAQDELYSAKLKVRVRAGMKKNADKCKFNGGSIPLGYYVDEDGRFQINEETAPLVKTIFKEYAEGRAIADIIRDLNAAGHRTVQGNLYNKNSFKRILINRRYLGIYIFGEYEVPGGMPQLIDEDTFNIVQLRVGENKVPARANRDYLLTGKLYCGKCGSLMVGTSGHSRDAKRTYHYYVCKNTIGKTKCDKAAIRRSIIEGKLIDECRKLLTDENIALIASKVADLCQRELSNDNQLEQMKQQRATLKKKISTLLDALEEGQAVEEIAGRITKRKEELRVTDERIAEKMRNRIVLEEDEIAFFLTSLRDGSADKPEYRKALITALINKVYLYDDKLIVHLTTSRKSPAITISLNDELLDEPPSGDSSYKGSSAPPYIPTPPLKRRAVFFSKFSLHRQKPYEVVCHSTLCRFYGNSVGDP